MARVTSLTEVFTAPADAVEDLDGASLAASVKIRPGNRGLPHYAPRGGIISTGASAVGTTQDNTGLAFGAGNLTIGFWVRAADWTPTALKYFLQKYASNLGLDVYLKTNGAIAVYIWNGAGSGTEYASPVNTLADGAWAFIAISLDRAGNASIYVNGALLGAVSIAAQSAQTITNTGPLAWGASVGGTSAWVGTFGESWIISGLLTATQIADIYRAGSIAPFAASFTFYTWPDFPRGYGPIMPDRSGNNQPALMGTSGLSHAVPRNPPGVPQRAPRAALVGDGSNGSFVRNSLGSQNPGTGELTLWWDGIVPTNSDSTIRVLAALSPNAAGVSGEVASGMIGHSSGRGISILLYGSPATEYTFLKSVDLLTLLAGKRAAIIWRRGSIFVGLDGDFFNATNLFLTEATASGPSLATAQVNGAYLSGFLATSGASSASSIVDLRLANVAMTEAQLRTEYEAGEPSALWKWGSNTELITGTTDRDFSGAGNWIGASGGTATVNAGKLDCTASGTGSGVNLASPDNVLVLGRSYRCRLTVSALSGGSVRVQLNGGSVSFLPVISADGTYDVYLTPTTGTQRLAIVSNNGVITWSLDNISLVQIGYTARLRTDTAAGLTALDGSSNKLDFLLSATGVTVSPDGRTQTIRASTNTSGNQQLLGAQCIDSSKTWRIRSWSIVTTGTPTVSLGNVSAGAQYASAVVLTASGSGPNIITLLTAKAGLNFSANLWCNSSSTAQLDHTIILDLVE